MGQIQKIAMMQIRLKGCIVNSREKGAKAGFENFKKEREDRVVCRELKKEEREKES